MDVSLQIKLPFYSNSFKMEYGKGDIEVQFRGTVFLLNDFRFVEEGNYTIANIFWEEILSSDKHKEEFHQKLVEKGIDFINFIIYHARTFDLETANMALVSPRNVRSVKLKIRIETKEFETEVNLAYQPPPYFMEFFEYINEPGGVDNFYSIIQDSKTEEIQLLEINLLTDAYHAIYEGRYSEAVICCLTALDAHISPLISKWLSESFLNKNVKNANIVLRDISTSAKLELLFGSIETDYLSLEVELLEKLKWANKLRNEIIHEGKRAIKNEANECLNTVSKLVLILFFKIEPGSLKN